MSISRCRSRRRSTGSGPVWYRAGAFSSMTAIWDRPTAGRRFAAIDPSVGAAVWPRPIAAPWVSSRHRPRPRRRTASRASLPENKSARLPGGAVLGWSVQHEHHHLEQRQDDECGKRYPARIAPKRQGDEDTGVEMGDCLVGVLPGESHARYRESPAGDEERGEYDQNRRTAQ